MLEYKPKVFVAIHKNEKILPNFSSGLTVTKPSQVVKWNAAVEPK